MELLWVVIVILYFVFTAMSQAQKRQRAEAEAEAELERAKEAQPADRGVRKPEPKRSLRLELPPEQETLVVPVVMRRVRRLSRRVPKSRSAWADGIIAAELLGLPRGLKPYRLPRQR